jgi:hypothetical protein
MKKPPFRGLFIIGWGTRITRHIPVPRLYEASVAYASLFKIAPGAFVEPRFSSLYSTESLKKALLGPF